MIIGITGKAQAGKSTVAGILEREFGFKEMAFADRLKSLSSTLLPNSFCTNHLVKMHGSNDDKNTTIKGVGVTYRQFLQKVGVAMRDIYPDVWVNLLEEDLENIYPEYDVVIADVRFDNEAAWIKKRKGKIILVERENSTGYVPNHVSEQGISNKYIDVAVKNKGNNLDDFEQDVGLIVQTFLL
jgi:hypothetical protein